jgi:nucleoside-diphosphate-sugar epimerase
MRALFIGGTGIISTAVSRLAVEKGVELYLLNRGKSDEFFPEGARRIVADMRDRDAVRAALGSLDFDAVVDWIAFTPDQVEADLSLFEGRTRQYVFISSASAYQKPPSHYLVTESTPLANPYWQYSRDKIACEELLNRAYRERGFPATIVRPSLTYGDTQIPVAVGSWQQPWTIVDRMRRGKRVVVQGDGSSLWTITHNSDFAKGFLGLLGNGHAIGHAFHITSDEVLTWDAITRTVGAAAGVEPSIVHVASDFICALYPDMLGSLVGDKSQSAVFDNSKIKAFVPDFVAATRFSEGIERTMRWFEAHPERCTIDDAFNERCDRIIEAQDRALAAAIAAKAPGSPS